jgi:tRNA nucleotidyltransferase/poly(A) polymerase
MNSFKNFLTIKEESDPIISKIKLNKSDYDSEFQPIIIDKQNHSNLRILLKAFAKSPEIGIGYTVLDKNKGEIEPKLKKKNIYLVGGAVRDHLKGKTPLNYNLVVDATPSEIEMILNHSKFEKDNIEAKYSYKAKRTDASGRPIEFSININGTNLYLSSLNKDSKSINFKPKKINLTNNLEEDAAGRDFTINALYIPLKNYDGENSELIDFYGGAHHLKNGQIVSIGSFSKKIKEDPISAHRYVRMESKYGKNKKFPEKYKELTKNIKDYKGVYKKEFLDGYENEDTDRSRYLNLYKDSGLIKNVYPGCQLDDDPLPQEFMGDKFLTSAWILKSNPSTDLDQLKISGWTESEIRDILYLINLYKINKNSIDNNEKDFLSQPCGLPSYKVNKWIKMF